MATFTVHRMISIRSMNNAKRLAAKDGIIPEQAPYFVEAQRSFIPWVFSNGKWRPRKDGWKHSEETKSKISNSMKGNQNARKENGNKES